MWSNGTNDDPGWPTLNNGAYDPWRESRQNFLIFSHRQREEDTRRTPGAPDPALGGITILLLLIGGSAMGGMRGLLAGQVVQALLLSGIGLCWLLGRRHGAGVLWLCRHPGRQYGRWGRPLLVAVVLAGLLSGCQDMTRATLKGMYGITVDPFPGPCAPASVQAGHCVTVKQGERP